MADYNTLQGERVFCHQCSNEWNRAEGGLLCPNCDSEFTEVLERPRSRRPDARPPPPIPQNHPFHDHHPWPQADISDPEEDDITTYQWNSPGGSGTFSFTSGTFISGVGRNGRNVDDDPTMHDLVQNFEGLLTRIAGTQNARNDPPLPQVGRGLFPFMGQPPFGPPPRGFSPIPAADHDGILRPEGRRDMPDQPFLNAQDMFSMIFGALNPPPPGGRARGPGQPHDLTTLLAELMGPRSGRAGDAVFTQEAFDQVISQLMEQNQGGTAPPPATEEAIDALPKKKVTADMMGNDGKVECSICMDDLELGAEVTLLPCDHWFHHECIKHWLKEHDTCPHCRKPIQDHSSQSSSPNSRRRRASASRRPSSVASPRALRPGDGTMHNPFTIPESPSGIRERRQQYFSNWNAQDGGDMNRSQSRRSSSAQSTASPGGGRSTSNSSNPGGAMGWMRSHMPFGG